MNNEDCYFFLHSSCKKGENCKYRHSVAALKTNIICTFWRQGRCTNQDCKFRHFQVEKNPGCTPCHFEASPKGCLKKNCPYLHQNGNMFASQAKVEDVKAAIEFINSKSDVASPEKKRIKQLISGKDEFYNAMVVTNNKKNASQSVTSQVWIYAISAQHSYETRMHLSVSLEYLHRYLFSFFINLITK